MPKALLSLSFLLLLLSCQDVSQIKPAGSVLILFDDYNVANWIQYQDSFSKYGIHSTLYISHFNQMEEKDRMYLSSLKEKGHEVAYHTLNHPMMSEENDQLIRDYLKMEIDSGLELMKERGFRPACFAFPGDRYSGKMRDSLQSRFASVRKGSFGYFEYWQRRREYSLDRNNPENFMCYDIGLNSLFADDDNMRMMVEDVENGKHVALLLHSFDDSTSIYTTPSRDFFQMIRMMQQRGASFKTVCKFFYPDGDVLFTSK